jgi:hypothetical protein
MKTTLILLPVLLGTLAACGTTNHQIEVERRESAAAGDAIRSASLNNAILAQHTLYPYHFVSGSAGLNALGERDLGVLAEHFLTSAGDLNVHRGDAGQALYEARVKGVLERLAAAGVQGGSVAVKDGLPGGDGLLSDRVIMILKERMSKSSSPTSGSTGASSTSLGAAGSGTTIP